MCVPPDPRSRRPFSSGVDQVHGIAGACIVPQDILPYSGKGWYVWVLTAPVLAIAARSIFDYWDYGQVHLFSLRGVPFDWAPIRQWSWDWLICQGMITPYTALFFAGVCHRKKLGAARCIQRTLSDAAMRMDSENQGST